ncbi:hypothetical protein LIER_37784 [Lithospermum erythrorhizon]|uniref:Uncharacterized protein n=1 Tax=Lithospermum erythrorhizon TaxID=34254 RepID=A0AAV3PUU4_LITER
MIFFEGQHFVSQDVFIFAFLPASSKMKLSSTPTNDFASSAPVNSSQLELLVIKSRQVDNNFQSRNGPSHLQPRQSREAKPVGTGKVLLEDNQGPLPDADPFHVPSRDSKQTTNVGGIKREVGVVGARCQSSDSGKLSSISSNMVSHHSQNVTPESTEPASSVGISFSNNRYGRRAHHSVGHPKAPQTNKEWKLSVAPQTSKEWKPKLNQKAAANGVRTIGSPTKAALPSDNSKNMETDSQLKDKHSQMNASENQNVIIAAHIRVSESDRYRLTFGSLRAELETASSGIEAPDVAEASTSDRSVRFVIRK